MESEGIGLMDLAAAGREHPQFGKSVWNVGRSRSEVFGSTASNCECGGSCGRGGKGSCNGSSTTCSDHSKAALSESGSARFGEGVNFTGDLQVSGGEPHGGGQGEICPEDCILAHSFIITGFRDSLVQGIKAWRFYQMFCGHIPGCPPHAEYGPPAPFAKTCGADVTDFVVETLEDIMFWGSLGGLWTASKGSPIDFKGSPDGKGKSTGCPKMCSYSVGLCGHCVTDQLPGNIGLGAATQDLYPLPLAEAAGQGDQFVSWLRDPDVEPLWDAPDDIEAYQMGRYYAYVNDLHPLIYHSHDKRKDLLCSIVNISVKIGETPVKDCVPCSDSWPA